MYPDVYWWLKGDSRDVLKGLWQSMSGEWAGDVDINDGKLQQHYTDYNCRMEELKNIGVGKSIEEIQSILNQEIITISADLSFVSNGWYIICTNILYKWKDLASKIFAVLP